MKLLVADIGGTNGRFGVVDYDPNSYIKGKINYQTTEQVTLKCADYPNMPSMIQESCRQLKVTPEFACLAIAGPIENGEAFMTNLNWRFTIKDLCEKLHFKSLHLINDFAAFAYAVPYLDATEFATLHSGKPNDHSPLIVMGPGTGFGMAQLIPDRGNWRVISTEAGHASFAPTNEKEIAIKSYLLKHQKHVSVENILSGNGLVNLYKALSFIAGKEVKNYSPADISTKGLANEDPICRDAVLTFCDVLGEVAGDKALSTGARGGVVIGGGITPKLLNLIPQSNFLERYKNKGPLVDYVSDISIRVILNDKAALVGSAAWLIHNTPQLQR